MKKTIIQLAALLIFSQISFAETNRLLITGSSTMAPVVSEIAKNFEVLQKNLRIDVQTGGSTRGISDVQRGLSDLGMSSRNLSKNEQLKVGSKTIALDGVGFLTNSNNPISNLTKSQITKILKGEINNWQELGGNDAKIVFINRAKGRSELELVSDYFKVKNIEFDADLIAGENQEVVKLVSQNINAISYISIGSAEYEIRNSTPLKLIALDGIAASRKEVLERRYPIARPLVLVTSNSMTKTAEQFLEFSLNNESQELFDKNYFIRVN